MSSSPTVLDNGFAHIPALFCSQQLQELEREYQKIASQAEVILKEISQGEISAGDYYRTRSQSLIAVAEADDPLKLCRFEYIAGSSDYFREQVIPRCAAEIERQINQPVTLFKDKCNLKSPGGGAFTAHQDIPAYIDFGPTIHVTAALFLDAANVENGALQVCENYSSNLGEEVEWLATGLGLHPLLPTYSGGLNNGRIFQNYEQQMQWQDVCTQPGDLLLFNSYIPHQSAINNSTRTRRAFFFTFNLQADGDHYQEYYRVKRNDYGNLRFHVATPTQHDGR